MSRYKFYDKPLTIADRDRFIAWCKTLNLTPSLGKWVASLTQEMNNDNTNRLYADAVILWKDTGLPTYPAILKPTPKGT